MGRRDRRGTGDDAAEFSSGTDRAALAETKICPVCRLPFSNRRKWAARGIWPSVVYCSERCRRGSSGSSGGSGGSGGKDED